MAEPTRKWYDWYYVSGMADELGFHGNELVHFQTIFTVGNVVALLPFMYLFPRVPMHYLVPVLDLLWGIFTLLQYRATSYAEIMAYRLFVSIFEIGRRGGAFYVGLTLGYLTASLLQSATLNNLDGVHGLAGWRWLFIVNAIITLPLAVIGCFIYPGTIDKPNRLVISENDLIIARKRLEKQGNKVEAAPFSWGLAKKIFTTKRFWLVLLWDSLFFNSSANTASFLLWLRCLNRYSTARLNELNSISPALGIFFILFINFSTDLFLPREWAITLASSFNFTSLVILAIWNVPEGTKWEKIEERAVVLVLITAVSTSWTAWIPLLTYPTVEGPRFAKWYVFSAVITGLLSGMTFVIRYTYGNNGEKNRTLNASGGAEETPTGITASHATSGFIDASKGGQVCVQVT
ncbi:major facilitator superfamily domain-containing protein [Aspergillus oleicola]